MKEIDRYARQRLIEWWDQARLQSGRILVAGAGALGNEVLKNLALLGVGHLMLVDFDQVERSNLSRMVLFSEADIGCSKVEAAAKALSRLNPEVSVRTINGDLFYDVGLGYYRHSDLVIGCLDSLAARSQTSLSCALAGVPFLDGGMWSLGGEVRWFVGDDGPCFDCTLSSDDWTRVDERRSCSGFRVPDWNEPERVPTVITTAAIIGGLLAQEAAKWLCNYPITPGKAIVYNGQTLTLHRSELARNPDCPSSHTPYHLITELPDQATICTARQLFARARVDVAAGRAIRLFPETPDASADEYSLELGRDFLLALHCPNCGRSKTINQLLGKVLESEQYCPYCGATRQNEVIHAINEESRLTDWPLAELGVPPGEVLAIRTPAGLLMYELTGDIEAK